jgi:CHAT domain-containing protein
MPCAWIGFLRRRPQPSQRSIGRTSPGLSRRGTVAAGAALSCLAGWLAPCSPPPPVPADRPVEGRLAGSTWAPYQGRPLPRPPSRRSPAGDRNSRAGEVATARRLAAEALREGNPDFAVARLRAATSNEPRAAPAWCDLAAAYLDRAELRSDPHDLVLALAAAARAVERNPRLSAARFNLALVLERYSLRSQAIREWQALARQERDPAWSREVRAHLAALASTRPDWQRAKPAVARAAAHRDRRVLRDLISTWPEECREYVEEEILPSWARAWLVRRDADAAQLLVMAEAIANGVLEVTGDGMASETVAQIERLRRRPGGAARVDAVAEGIRAYEEGLVLVREGSFSRALSPLRSAAAALEAQDSPFAAWARCQIAYCHYQRYEYDPSHRLFVALAEGVGKRPWPALRGRALWMSGLIDLIRGDLTSALTVLTTASSDFHRLGEAGHEAMVASLVATGLAALGRRAEAWQVLYPALRTPPAAPRPRSAIYGMAVFMALDEGELAVALRFQDEMLSSAGETGEVSAVAEGWFDRAFILTALGDAAAASTALAEAARRLPLIPDARTRRLTEGNILLAQGRLRSQASPLAAIALLDRAIEILRATDSHWALGQALYQRAMAERNTGRAAAVERDLSEAIAESERQRERITPIEQRISYFDQNRAVVEAMVSFQRERGSSAKALAYSERARARALTDWILAQPGGQPPPPATLRRAPRLDVARQLQERLSGDVAVIEYWLQRASLDIWVVRRSALETRHLGIAASSLEPLVYGLRRAVVQEDRAEISRASAALYDILIRPIAHLLPPGSRLVFVPDGALHALSFALLRDRRTGRCLVQDHPSSVAPSAAVFASCLRREDRLSPTRQRRVLVIADPAFDEQLYPDLRRLRGGAIEQLIPRLFPGSRVLRDRQATRSTFLATAGDFEILHFGGHAVLNPRSPLLSQLVFAQDDPGVPGRGVLYSGEILGRRFARTRLVVLASCATAAGQVSRTEGVESLARPLLAAGVPAVIASLWAVEDEATARFFDDFYRHLSRQGDAAKALQAAQIDALEHGSERTGRPYCWAAFELIGAGFGKTAVTSTSTPNEGR